MAKRRYQVSDGKLLLTLEPDNDGWFVVTSPTDPAMITQARSIEEAFTMARDAFAALATSRAEPDRWKFPPRKSSRSRAGHRPVGAGI
jgi:predicted RNase H-like HicB family nuclease